MAFYKNTASQKVSVLAVNPTTGSGVTGNASSITAQISKDGGSSAATNDTNPTELNATHHPGVYIFDLTQAETNANMVIVSATSATHPVAFDPVTIYTTNLDDFKADVSAVSTTSQLQGVSGVLAATRTELATVDGNVDSIKTKTDSLTFTTSNQVDARARTIDNDLITAAAIAADAIGASELAADAVAEIADQVWNESQSGHTSAGTFGKYLDSEVSSAATLGELQGVSGVVATTSQLIGVSGKLVSDIDAVPTAAETYAEFISGTNENAFKADVSTLATTSQLQGVSGVVVTTSQLVGVSGKLVADIDAVPTAAETYAEFISGSNEDAFKANVSALATTSQLQGVSGVITATRTELADAATLGELQGVSGVMATTSQLVGVSGKIVTDIEAVPTAAETYAEFISGTNENAFKADITTLATTSQLQGVSGVLTATRTELGDAATLSELQGVSGVMAKAADVATTSQLVGVSGVIRDDIISISGVSGGGDSASTIYTYFTDGTREDAFKADITSVATTSQLQGVSGVVATTSQLVGVSGKIVADVAAVPTAAETYTEFISGTNENAFKADVTTLATTSQLQGVSGVMAKSSGLSTLATSSELVGVSGVIRDDIISISGVSGGGDSSATIYTYFTDGTRENAFKADVSAIATTSQLQGVSGVMATTSQLVGVSGVLKTDIDAVPTAAETYAEFISGTNENAFKADVSSLATTSQLQGVSGVLTVTRTELGDAATLSELQGVSGVMAKAADVATTSELVGVSGVIRDDIISISGVSGGGGDSASTIYTYFTDGTREDVFKADVSAVATTPQLQGVSGVLATSSELIGVSGVVNSVKTKTDQLTFTASNLVDSTTKAMDNDVITAAVIATNAIGAVEIATDAVDEMASAVWDKSVSGHSTTGTFGKNLDSQVSENTPAKAYTYFTTGDNEDVFKSTFSITATGIVAQLNSTTYDSVTFENAMKTLLSMSSGKIIESSTGVFDFYSQDNATKLFTLTKSGNQRTRS